MSECVRDRGRVEWSEGVIEVGSERGLNMVNKMRENDVTRHF